jgi:uncharacterized protein (TIGR02996 family)
MNEQALLDAIRAAPHDAALRLVYADRLEERGDVRGEFVRVEEEMRRLPAFADRFWQLKPRRNELRALATPEWLEAMRYGTDVWPVFGHGVPDGWRERWRLIRELVERWHGPPMADVGGREAEVREVEDWRPDTPGAIGFTNAKDRGAYISVVTLGQPRDHYSVMVEAYRQGSTDFPFDVAVDRQGLRLPELLDLIAPFLDIRTVSSTSGSDRHKFNS